MALSYFIFFFLGVASSTKDHTGKSVQVNPYAAECNYCDFSKHSSFCTLIFKLLLNLCMFFWVTETADRHPLCMLF